MEYQALFELLTWEVRALTRIDVELSEGRVLSCTEKVAYFGMEWDHLCQDPSTPIRPCVAREENVTAIRYHMSQTSCLSR